MRQQLAAMVALGFLAAGASGQSVLFIAPDPPTRAEAGVGQSVVVSALRGTDAAAAVADAWPTARIAWMFIRSGGGHQNFEPGTPAPDAGRSGPGLTLAALDAALVGVDLEPRDEELGGKALSDWAGTNIEVKLLPKGFEAVAGMDKVVVRRVESAKTLMRGRGAGEQMRGNRPARSATATDKSGQAVEIRPMLDMTAATTPTDVPVRLYAFSEGAKGALLRVLHVASGEEQRIIANDKGIAWIRVERAGEYRLAFHAAAPFVASAPPADDGSKATWTLHSATCTFVAPSPPRPPAKAEEEKSR